jgi:hypothetical protein
VKVRQLREHESSAAIIKELMADCDNAMKVDCASMRVTFVVEGWFVFPKGTMSQPSELEHGA